MLSKWITGSEDGTIRIWVRSSCTVWLTSWNFIFWSRCNRVPVSVKTNKFLLTGREGHTGEYGPEVVVVWTECNKARYKWLRANIPQYGSSKQSMEVVWCMALAKNLFDLKLLAFWSKNTRLVTVSVEKVPMEKFRPAKNQSERWDLPQDYLAT